MGEVGLTFDIANISTTLSSTSSSPSQEIQIANNSVNSDDYDRTTTSSPTSTAAETEATTAATNDHHHHQQQQQSNDDLSTRDDEDSISEEVHVGSLDKFLSFSSVSRKISWQRSLLELDKNLQRICAPSSSPSEPSQTSHSLCNSPVNAYRNLSRAGSMLGGSYKEKRAFLDWGSGRMDDEAASTGDSGGSSINGSKSPRSRRFQNFLRRADSMLDSSPQKSVAVRHIETHGKLHDKLLKITGAGAGGGGSGGSGGGGGGGGGGGSGDRLKCSPKARREIFFGVSQAIQRKECLEAMRNFESFLEDGIELELENNLQRLDVEDLTVQVNNSRLEIEVRCRQIFDRSAAKESDVFKLDRPLERDSLCLLKQDGRLKICRGVEGLVRVNCHPVSEVFHLPVIKGDEQLTGEYSMAFWVPSELHCEDISVKTIDEFLHVSGQKRRYSANYPQRSYKRSGLFSCSVDEPGVSSIPEREENELLSRASEFNENQQVHVIVRLPSCVDTRSVSSYLNHHHLLIVKTSGISR